MSKMVILLAVAWIHIFDTLVVDGLLKIAVATFVLAVALTCLILSTSYFACTEAQVGYL